ncbi:hypothetical protein M8J76_013678 [Diaphorina citri]|nr:hypothetical protein M8J76_013678 [Diaphorina citri]
MGYTKQAIAAFSASLPIFIVGCWLTWPSVALYKWQTKEYVLPFELDAEKVSWVVATMDLGNILSPIPSGYIMDKFGRKNTLLLTSLVFLTSSLLTIFAQSSYWLFTSRLLSGIGKGVGFTVVPMYIAEITDKEIRGTLSTMFTGHLYGGILFSLCVGPYIQYQTLNIILGVIPLVFFITFMFIPETPYFHIIKDNDQVAAKKSLEWFKGKSQNITEELDEIVLTTNENMKNKSGYRELVSNYSYRKALIIVLVTSFLQRLSGVSTILSYASTTLPEHHGLIGRTECLIIFSVLLVVTNFACSPLVDIAGRKTLNMLSAFLSSGVMIVLAACFYWNFDYWVSYLFTSLFGITYSLGIGIIPTTLLSELFPTNVKSSAASIASIAFALASFLINKFYKIVQINFGLYYMFAFYAICSGINVLFTFFFIFETKGKSFQQIQNILKEKTATTQSNEYIMNGK